MIEISVVTWGSEWELTGKRENHKGTGRRRQGPHGMPIILTEVRVSQHAHMSKLTKFAYFMYGLLGFNYTSTKL